MTDLTNRVSKLEHKTNGFDNDIHDIKTDVHDIKKDVEDGKRITNMNTKEIKDTNKILTDMHLVQVEAMAMFKGGVTTLSFVWKITKWIASVGMFVGGAYFAYLGIS